MLSDCHPGLSREQFKLQIRNLKPNPYLQKWTKMSLHQHTTVLRTCVGVCGWMFVCERVCVWGRSILGVCRVMNVQQR